MEINLKPQEELCKLWKTGSHKYINPDQIPSEEYAIVHSISVVDWCWGDNIRLPEEIVIPLDYYDIIELDSIGDVSDEKLSLRWALYRQLCAGNNPDISLLDTEDTVFPTKYDGGFMYRDFPEDKWAGQLCDTSICKKYRWIWLPIEVLEWLLQVCFEHDVHPERLIRYPDNPSRWFDILELPESISRFELIYPKFLNDHTDESELQGEEISLRRREPSGTVVYFGGCSPSITVGHLSYTKILEGS